MFSKLGLQLYTVRELLNADADERSMDKTIERLVAMGYTEWQTAGIESETYARIANKHGMTFAGTHYNYDKIINEIDVIIKGSTCVA